MTYEPVPASAVGRGSKLRGRRRWLAVVAALMLAGTVQMVSPSTASADAPNVVSKNGITVGATRWISSRTFEVDISTSLINPAAVNGPHRIRITFPNNYFQNPTARFPVLYLLHGGAGGNSAQWTTGGGDAEGITNNKPIITVMADGGKVGWFTNWVNDGGKAQKWADFYLTQLIPWVDGNLRTVAAKNGRAIAGLSMGGYGAMRLAQDRPDLFASVASFSGALDLENLSTQLVISEQSIQNGFAWNGPFGTTSPSVNPLKRTDRFVGQNMQILLYAGSGISDADAIERTMGWSTELFSRELAKRKLPYEWTMYGRPGPSVPYGCDGGHNFSCWNYAFWLALPRMLTVLAVPGGLTTTTTTAPPTTTTTTPPPAGSNLLVNGGFESGTTIAPWSCGGNCGRDGANLARTGVGNGWVRNNTGWNNLYQTVSVTANTNYRLTGWIRTSANNKDGYTGVRTTGGAVIGEKKFGSYGGYTQVTVDVNSGSNTSLVIYAGLWANGDTYLQLDDVTFAKL